ncbi:MAG TPA: tetratricopeptide repeat protein, partial [Gemmatimonadota bacterium]|nr:tetratricopeptide repeat protein [Gemmatimonadota bacterium]
AVRSQRVGVGTIAALAVCYAMAGLSKEAAFVMPALLLATDLELLSGAKRGELRRFVGLRLPTFATLAVVLALLFVARWAVLGSVVGSAPARIFALDDSFSTRLFTMARVWPRYLELLLFPLDLSADYSPAVVLPASGLTPMGAVGFCLLLVAAGAAVAAFRRAPDLTLALAWLAVTLLPVSNLLFTAETVLGERRLYLPSVAVSLAAALLMARARGGHRRWLAVAVGAWVVFFSVITVQRNPVWRSTDTVFADLLQKHPESSRALFALGLRHHELGHAAEARVWLDRSLEVWPWYAPYLVRYAIVLAEQGEFALAAERARAAIELDPGRIDHHKLLVSILLLDGQPAAALAAIQAASRVVEPDASLYTQESDARFRLGDVEGAVRAQEAAMGAGRNDWRAWLRLAQFRAALGDTAGALEALQTGRRLPDGEVAVADSLEAIWTAAAPR